jgi:DNA-binding transcriptional MocR family regulator
LNVVLTLPDGTDEQAVVARAAERGVGVYPRRWFAADPGGARPGLVLGYGTVPPEQAGWGCGCGCSARSSPPGNARM